MKKFSFFHPLAFSFFSRDLYDDLARNGKGVGFLYLLMLVVVGCIPVAIKTSLAFDKFASQEAPKIINQLPEVAIVDGTASLTAPMPYVIKDPQTGNPLIIFDTTGQTTSLDNSPAVLLMTKSNFILKKSPSETRIHSFAKVKHFSFGRERVTGWLATTGRFVAPVTFALLAFSSLLYRFIQVLIYAAVGTLFLAKSAPIDYATRCRIAAAAITPAYLLNAAVATAALRIPFWGLICLAMSVGYVYFGVTSVAAAPSEPASAPAAMS